ncbi:glutathione S-transferase family protein, partial [Aeromonas dhakensis]
GLEVHMLDRVFDNYVMTPMQKVVLDMLRPAADRDRYGVVEARELLDQIYLWLDQRLEGRHWIAGAGFTLADCAAAPSLFYADWAHEIPAGYGRLRAYRARLLSHPSIVRVVEEARPFRHYFPLGAPARD